MERSPDGVGKFVYITKFVSQFFSLLAAWFVLGGAPQFFFPLVLLVFFNSTPVVPAFFCPSAPSSNLSIRNLCFSGPLYLQWSSGNCFHLLPLSSLPSPLTTPSPCILAGCSSACIVLPLAPALSAIRGPGERTLAQISILWMWGGVR